MVCRLIGKTHIQGKSKKTGKDLNLNLCHIAYKEANTEGETVKSVFISPKLAEYDSLHIGGTYDCQCDFNGHISTFTYVK